MFKMDFLKSPKSIINEVLEKQKNRKELIELNAWKTHVRSLCKLIDREIYELNDVRFPFLWDKKVAIKQEKRTALRLLLDAKNLEELKEISQKLNEQGHVVQGWTSRTKELVMAILEGKRPTQLDEFISSGFSRKVENILNKFS